MSPGAVASEFEALERTLEDKRQDVELALRSLLRPGDSPAVAAAMEDSLLAPGKRLRPVLALMAVSYTHLTLPTILRV